MTAEDQLRRALTDDRYAMAPWPDPVGRITSGVERRIRRRRVRVVTSVVVLAVTAASVPALLRSQNTAMPAGGDQIVPWRAAPTPPPTHLARRGPRADAPACTATDLNRSAWLDAGASQAGNAPYTVLLSNNSDSRCTLRDSAQLVATDTDTGDRVAVPTEALANDDLSQYPATLDPGELARIDVRAGRNCADESPKAAHYGEVALIVLGREIPVWSLSFTAWCPVRVGAWRVLPPLLNVPFIVASIDAPGTVQRGQTIQYVVTLLNSGPQPHHLDPCPRFTQQLESTRETHRLNCAVSTIAPHQSVRFAMRLAVPADAAPGDRKLNWMGVTDDGRVIVADLATGGVPLHIRP
ncbi:DUF4232 domain-containing protein [Actinomycetes bacterium KLBMP 9797]